MAAVGREFSNDRLSFGDQSFMILGINLRCFPAQRLIFSVRAPGLTSREQSARARAARGRRGIVIE